MKVKDLFIKVGFGLSDKSRWHLKCDLREALKDAYQHPNILDDGWGPGDFFPYTTKWFITGWKTNRRWDLVFISDSRVVLKYNKRKMLDTDDLDVAINRIKEHNEELIVLERKIINTKAVADGDAGRLIMESLRAKMPDEFMINYNGKDYVFSAASTTVEVRSDNADLMITVETPIASFKFKIKMANPSFVPDEFADHFFQLMANTMKFLDNAADAIKSNWENEYIQPINNSATK